MLRLLSRYDYPTDKEERGIQLVFERAELPAGEAAGAGERTLAGDRDAPVPLIYSRSTRRLRAFTARPAPTR
ncbi:MAG: DUF3387 domain-containing protein [Acidimicrobiia bacterium]|nr:DUF3387 domain-containing protein [Acidimicrobiia bacterium]